MIRYRLPIRQRLGGKLARLAKYLLAFVGKPRLAYTRLADQADYLPSATAHPRPTRLE